jgi:hypothetical protein
MTADRAPDSGVHQAPSQELTAVMRRAIREELILAEPACRPPSDHDAECLILAARLDGQVTLDALTPLAPRHIFTPWIADALDALADPACGLAGVQAHLVGLGYPVGAIAELHTVADCSPIVAPERVMQAAARIVELSRRRDLMAACTRVIGALSVETIDFDGAVGVLRTTILEVRS